MDTNNQFKHYYRNVLEIEMTIFCAEKHSIVGEQRKWGVGRYLDVVSVNEVDD